MSEFAAQVQCYCAVDTEGHLWSPAEGCTRSPVPEPAAPAAEADLRADLMKWLSLRVGGLCWDEAPWQEWGTEADELLALPALQRLVAEAAEARRLRETCPACEHTVDSHSGDFCEAAMCHCNETNQTLRRALDGTDG